MKVLKNKQFNAESYLIFNIKSKKKNPLVSSINKGSTHKYSVGLVIETYRTLVHIICRCVLVHVRRSINQVTHCLVKISFSGSCLVKTYFSGSEVDYWKGCPRPFLQNVLGFDSV